MYLKMDQNILLHFCSQSILFTYLQGRESAGFEDNGFEQIENGLLQDICFIDKVREEVVGAVP